MKVGLSGMLSTWYHSLTFGWYLSSSAGDKTMSLGQGCVAGEGLKVSRQT
jgi:hypothetical protein